jgi:type IV secretory pathway VirB2 component (pilin)
MSKSFKTMVTKMNKAVAERRAKLVAASLLALAGTASAQSGSALDTAMLGNFGCAIYNFLTGPLAIWAFILVLVGTLLVGLIAKIDFSKIIVVVVVFALIQAIGTYVMSMDSVASKIGTASCLTA